MKFTQPAPSPATVASIASIGTVGTVNNSPNDSVTNTVATNTNVTGGTLGTVTSVTGATINNPVTNPALVTGISGEASLLTWSAQTIAGYASAVLDVRQYTSYHALVTNNSAAVANLNTTSPNCMEWKATWYSDSGGTNVVWVERFGMVAAAEKKIAGGGDTHGSVLIQDRMHGPFMKITTTSGFGTNTNFTGFLHGSNIPVDQVRVREICTGNNTGSGTDNMLLSAGTALGKLTINASTTLGCCPAVSSGAACLTLQIQPNTSTGSFFFNIFSPMNNQDQFFEETASSSNKYEAWSLQLPRLPLYIQAVNLDATNPVVVSFTLVAEET